MTPVTEIWRGNSFVLDLVVVLRQRKIVVTRKVGLNIYYKIANRKMMKACDILRDVLFEQLKDGERLARGITGAK